MKIFKLNSPNCNERSSVITSIVIHHTNMKDADSALKRLCNLESSVSCHYLIDNYGKTYQLVPDELRAWHAGESFWRGRNTINDISIGIELDNNGADPFPRGQIISLITLCKDLLLKHPTIELRNIIAHYDIAPHRKDDPNYLFNWQLLAQNGIGIFPEPQLYPGNITHNFSSSDIINIQQKLSIYGYKINLTGEFDFQTNQVIIAFKRHFCSDSFLSVNQEIWTIEAELKLNKLMSMINGKS